MIGPAQWTEGASPGEHVCDAGWVQIKVRHRGGTCWRAAAWEVDIMLPWTATVNREISEAERPVDVGQAREKAVELALEELERHRARLDEAITALARPELRELDTLGDELLHPNGRCSCWYEGRCDWCVKTDASLLESGLFIPENGPERTRARILAAELDSWIESPLADLPPDTRGG
jgi:hypothetical protein